MKRDLALHLSFHSRCDRRELPLFSHIYLSFHTSTSLFTHPPLFSRIRSLFIYISLFSLIYIFFHRSCRPSQFTASHCNTLQHTATRCNTLQHSTTHTAARTILSSLSIRCIAMRHTATQQRTATTSTLPQNTLQHTATHCNSL